jgi:hypothetical protein
MLKVFYLGEPLPFDEKFNSNPPIQLQSIKSLCCRIVIWKSLHKIKYGSLSMWVNVLQLFCNLCIYLQRDNRGKRFVVEAHSNYCHLAFLLDKEFVVWLVALSVTQWTFTWMEVGLEGACLEKGQGTMPCGWLPYYVVWGCFGSISENVLGSGYCGHLQLCIIIHLMALSIRSWNRLAIANQDQRIWNRWNRSWGRCWSRFWSQRYGTSQCGVIGGNTFIVQRCVSGQHH